MKIFLSTLSTSILLATASTMAAETATLQSDISPNSEFSAQDLGNVQESISDQTRDEEIKTNQSPILPYYRCPPRHIRRRNARGYCCVRIFYPPYRQTPPIQNDPDNVIESSGKSCDQ